MELCSPLLLYVRNSYIQELFQGIGKTWPYADCQPGGKTNPHSKSVPLLPISMLRVLELTCVVAVVVCIAQHCVRFVHGTTRVVAQFSTGVGVAPAGLHTLPSPRLVFVIWVVLLVLHTEPLGLLHEWPLLAFTQQAAENIAEQGWAPANTLLPGVR